MFTENLQEEEIMSSISYIEFFPRAASKTTKTRIETQRIKAGLQRSDKGGGEAGGFAGSPSGQVTTDGQRC